MDAYLVQQTRGAFAEHNGNYDDPGATSVVRKTRGRTHGSA